jgi:hypothetical protein
MLLNSFSRNFTHCPANKASVGAFKIEEFPLFRFLLNLKIYFPMSLAYQVIVPGSFSSLFLATSIDCKAIIFSCRIWVCYINFTKTSHKSRKNSFIGQVFKEQIQRLWDVYAGVLIEIALGNNWKRWPKQ